VRLFVAINLPDRRREEIHDACSALRSRELPIRWVSPDHYHVTMKFLGKVDRDGAAEVTDVMKRVASSTTPFEAGLGGFGAFPTIRRPRVLWLGVEANPELRALKQDLEWGLGERGFPREVRTFHPHVTLGRVPDRVGAGAFRGLDEVTAGMGYEARVSVSSLDLMRSVTLPEGPQYSLLSSIPLGEAG
jgi:2'-5' RNA ligase